MKFTFYGHSCFLVETIGKKLLFDPFITPNELAKNIEINSIDADYILVSHGHFDHIADCVALAQATNAKVICNWEIYEWLGKQKVSNAHPMNTGGKREFDGFTVRCTAAQHSSGLPDGSYGGNPMGFIISSAEGSFYYSGDTALTMDMQLIPKWAKLNFAVLPIGDNFTMDYEDAAEAARMIDCKTVVGVHYDTFGFIRIDHQKAKQVFEKAGCLLHLPGIGETITLK
ncbi:MAG TPA: metal-dependent hydrolase [Chitinophagaceae bacterium]|nr:metal-dependent hydrolase [Chitinophagaceae bacterium]